MDDTNLKIFSLVGLHRFLKFTAVATFFLLCAGALVTSTGSGLAVPDWPLSYGQFFPPMIGGILYEHGHRMIAGCVGILAFVQAVLLFLKEPRRWVRVVGMVAFLVIVLQAVLGGMTVLFLLPHAVSISHAGLAEIFFSLMVSLALFTSPRWKSSVESGPSVGEAFSNELSLKQGKVRLRFLSTAVTLLIYVQILLGAFFRHTGSGILAHILGASVVTLGIGWLVSHVLKKYFYERHLLKLALTLMFLLILQLPLGVASYWIKMATLDLDQPHPLKVILTAVHLALGALMLATSLVLTLWAFAKDYSVSGPVPPHPHRRHQSRHGFFQGMSRILSRLAGVRWGAPSRATRHERPFKKISNYFEMTKPRIVMMVLVTTAMGFCLGSWGAFNFALLFQTLLGTALVGGGACVLNEYIEIDADGLMKRTCSRPLPAGKIEPPKALLFGIMLSILGILHLVFWVNLLTGMLASLTLVSYIFIYTPLKKKTTLCTLMGAIPGAIPPAMGWAAARDHLGGGAWILFGILYMWQLPHFLSLAGIYREDYQRGGFQMLPVLDKDGRLTGRQILLYTVALMCVSLVPTLQGLTGAVYFFGALALGFIFLGVGVRSLFPARRSGKEDSAVQLLAVYRKLFRVSILYLPLLLVLMWVDKI
ncbi:MAG: protoheme IX farnesyltransferase [Chlamydiae bacterium]|nr:protoheme IX farnesyltransferase [Chlamydiota bacterium]MBI3265589.1 protoheme IX farnesyltransferase [Chlamydiota bacterium]